MESFSEYVTKNHCDCLCRLLAKERIKQGVQNKLGSRDSESMIRSLMPCRNEWIRLRKSTRVKDISKETLGILTIRKTIVADRRRILTSPSPSLRYLSKLDQYTSEISDIAAGRSAVAFSRKDYTIIPKFKGDEGHDAIYRPLCVYNNLDTKILISAASAYFTQCFDAYLHEEILSYRPRRMYHGVKTTTSGNDAIRRIKQYLEEHRGQNIYVAECDIQKFFDIINHDVVLDCFDRLAQKAGIPDYHQVRNILEAYLDSYGFVPDVLELNNTPSFWTMPAKKHRGAVKGKFMFKWVKEEDFLEAYTKEEFAEVRDRLGVPQGGALSCVISNVVLNDVDQAIIQEEDTDRLFIRYGDDIILMHTDKEKCEELLERYKQSLVDHKLIYHKFEDFSNLKAEEKITKAFWKGKSKPVFFWGPGDGNASEWIGFVGYEISYQGATRLRLSTLDKKFGDINKKYHRCLESREASPEKLVARAKTIIASLPSSIKKFTELDTVADANPHLARQLRSLDAYRYKKLRKLDQKLSKRCPEGVNLTEHFRADEGSSFYRAKFEKRSFRLEDDMLVYFGA